MRKHKKIWKGVVISAIVALVFVFSGEVNAIGGLVLNELMWDGTEYIEMFNATGAEVSLAGWTITRHRPSPEATAGTERLAVAFDEDDLIGAGEYFLIERKEDATSVAADKIVSELVLVNTGELVRLKDSSGVVIDSANRLDSWFAGKDTTVGEAMERSDANADGTLEDSWHTSTGSVGGRIGTPGQANSAVPVNHAPVAAISVDGDEILVGESVTFSAEDSSDEDGDSLMYTWSFGDGSSGAGSVVTHAYTSAGSKTVSVTVSDGELADDASVAITVVAPVYSSAIVINEFLPDPVGSDTTGEFIELLNTGSSVVDVGGWQVDDADGGSSAYTIPAGTMIAAGGYLSLTRAVTKIALNNDGDTVRLLTPDKTVKASFAYGDSSEGQSWNKQGSGYVESTTVTPGAVNVITAPSPEATAGEAAEGADPQYSDDVLINEWLANPTGNDAAGEFIELMNTGSASINLAGWKLDDEEGGSSPYTIPAGTTIAAKGFLVLERGETKLALNNDGDTVRLLDPSGKVVSTFTYEDSVDEGVAWARDVKGSYVLTATVTKGKANIITTTPLRSSSSAGQAGSVTGTSAQSVLLKNIRELEEGVVVTTEGVVSAPPGVLGKGIVYVAGSGVQVYFSDDEYPELAVGDRVKITGEVGAMAGETRLKLAAATDIAVVKKDAVPLPHEVKTGEVGEAVEGFLVVIVGKVTQTSGDTFYVDDGSGAVKVFIKESTGIEKPKMKKGDLVTIIGVVSQTSSGYRILPRFQEDVHMGAVAGLKTFPKAGIANACLPARSDLWMLAAAVAAVSVICLPMLLERVRL